MRSLILCAALALAVTVARGADADRRFLPTTRSTVLPATRPTSRPAALDLSRAIRALPREAQPGKRGWDDFNGPKARAALTRTFVGKTVALSGSLRDKPSLSRYPNEADDSKTDFWLVSVYMDPPALKLSTVEVHTEFTLRGAGPGGGDGRRYEVVAILNEAQAVEIKTWKEGDAATLYATIDDFDFQYREAREDESRGESEVRLKLGDWRLLTKAPQGVPALLKDNP